MRCWVIWARPSPGPSAVHSSLVNDWVGVGDINDVEVKYCSAISATLATTYAASSITSSKSSFASTSAVTKTTMAVTTTVYWVDSTLLVTIVLTRNFGWTVDPSYFPREVCARHSQITRVLPCNIWFVCHELHFLNFDAINDGIDLCWLDSFSSSSLYKVENHLIIISVYFSNDIDCLFCSVALSSWPMPKPCYYLVISLYCNGQTTPERLRVHYLRHRSVRSTRILRLK